MNNKGLSQLQAAIDEYLSSEEVERSREDKRALLCEIATMPNEELENALNNIRLNNQKREQ